MNDAFIETIHRYLYGDMTSTERDAFEKEIETNKPLQQALALEKALLNTLKDADELQLKESIRSVHRKLQKEDFFSPETAIPQNSLTHKTNQRFIMNRKFAIAAAVLFLLGVVWFTFGRKNNADPNALFAKYYQVDHQKVKETIASLTSYGMAGVQTEQDSLKEALVLFDQGNYSACIKVLNPLLKSHPDNETAQYYLALSHLNEGRYAKAVELLDPLASSPDFPMRYDAKWNLGLCYLKVEGGMRLTLKIFEDLSKDINFPRHREAGAMYNMLK